jgi:hypothetical protein
MQSMLTKIEFDIISARALSKNEVDDLQELVVKGLKNRRHKNNGGPNDNCGEGVFDLDDGSLHFFTYKLRDDLVLEVFLFPR